MSDDNSKYLYLTDFFLIMCFINDIDITDITNLTEKIEKIEVSDLLAFFLGETRSILIGYDGFNKLVQFINTSLSTKCVNDDTGIDCSNLAFKSNNTQELNAAGGGFVKSKRSKGKKVKGGTGDDDFIKKIKSSIIKIKKFFSNKKINPIDKKDNIQEFLNSNKKLYEAFNKKYLQRDDSVSQNKAEFNFPFLFKKLDNLYNFEHIEFYRQAAASLVHIFIKEKFNENKNVDYETLKKTILANLITENEKPLINDNKKRFIYKSTNPVIKIILYQLLEICIGDAINMRIGKITPSQYYKQKNYLLTLDNCGGILKPGKTITSEAEILSSLNSFNFEDIVLTLCLKDVVHYSIDSSNYSDIAKSVISSITNGANRHDPDISEEEAKELDRVANKNNFLLFVDYVGVFNYMVDLNLRNNNELPANAYVILTHLMYDPKKDIFKKCFYDLLEKRFKRVKLTPGAKFKYDVFKLYFKVDDISGSDSDSGSDSSSDSGDVSVIDVSVIDASAPTTGTKDIYCHGTILDIIQACERSGADFIKGIETCEKWKNSPSQDDCMESILDALNTAFKSNTIDGGGKIVKNYLKELYKCKDNRLRKAFRIKGRGNSIFVNYKGCATVVSKVPENKIVQKGKK